MLHKTRGIVFRTTEYSESSVIVQVFTEKFGMQSYLINGVKKAGARIRMNMLQPLHLLDLVVYHKPAANIQRIAELRNDPVFETIPYNIVKSSLALFLNEVLYKSIRHQYADNRLFEYLYHSIELLDRADKGLANYHLWFLIGLSRYLGFYPHRSSSEAQVLYFDLRDGVFTTGMPAHLQVIQGAMTRYFSELLTLNMDSLHKLVLSHSERKELLRTILDYYRLHVDSFGEVKSHDILEEVLKE